jgi:hypothetical protein
MAITHCDTRLLVFAAQVLGNIAVSMCTQPHAKPQNRETTFERKINESLAYSSEGQADLYEYKESTPTAPTSEERCNRSLTSNAMDTRIANGCQRRQALWFEVWTTWSVGL